MRLLICGDRHWEDKNLIKDAILVLPVLPEVIIEGEAPGADRLAREVARGLAIPILPFAANWKRYNKAAGPIRNKQMLIEGRPTVVWAFHDNFVQSRGTRDMVKRAGINGIPVRLYSHSCAKGVEL